MPQFLSDERLSGCRAVVMGLGRFGGGVGVVEWLVERGADVLVTDLAEASQLAPAPAAIQARVDAGQVTLRLGGHNVSDFTTCDVVIANPAVARPWENRYLRAATAAGIPITTEIRLLAERLPRRQTIGVTGSAGKSTTAAMIGHILNSSGRRAVVGGNIGGSLLGRLDEIDEDMWAVLELSSAQLYWLGEGVGYPEAAAWSPHVAVLTNLAANHLDWHGDYAHYRDSKRNIVRGQRYGAPDFDRLITAVDVGDAAVAEWVRDDGAVVRLGEGGDDEGVYEAWRGMPRLRLPGRHNRANGLLALGAAWCAVNSAENCGKEGEVNQLGEMAATLESFSGLPHRLQLVGEFAGVRVYNDSKCTTPEGARLGIAAFADEADGAVGKVHLIAGGYDKGVDLAPMVGAAAGCAAVYCMGATGAALAAAVAAAGGRAVECGELAAAVARACAAVGEGEILLLSPGCASWDQFRNFAERGDDFVELVRKRLGGR